MVFDWNLRTDIAILEIFDCVGGICSGSGVPMANGPFKGAVIAFNGTGSTLLDNATWSEYTVSESTTVIAGLIADQTSGDDYIKRVANGEVSGQKIMRGLGERESIQGTATGEDIWRGNELSSTPSAPASTTTIPIPSSAGEQMTVISESTLDNGVGVTGALTIMIDYLDATGTEQTTVHGCQTPASAHIRLPDRLPAKRSSCCACRGYALHR